MADDFGSENLEDGELWLPSDFFSMDDQVSNKITTITPLDYHSNSSANFLEQNHHHNRNFSQTKPIPALQRFKPSVWYGSDAGGGGAHDFCACRTGTHWTGCSPVYHFSHLNPVQAQVENFMGERQRQQQQNRLILNRVGASGGTGVFLPRISSDSVMTRNQNRHCGRKGQRMMNKHESQLPPRKILLNRRQEEDCFGYVTSQVGLRNNWNA